MTVIIRDFKQYTVTEKHLQALLGFVEEDIHDHTKQGTAFPLLKVRSMIYASWKVLLVLIKNKPLLLLHPRLKLGMPRREDISLEKEPFFPYKACFLWVFICSP